MDLDRLEKIKKAVSMRQSNLIVVLEGVYDQHNTGAVLRTCDSFGIQNIYIIFDKEKEYNLKRTGSSSSSANKWVDTKFFKNIESCINSLKKDGYTIISTVLDEKSSNIFEISFVENEKIAILLGNEHRGLSDKAISLSDKKVFIPMLGMIQSLNISVAAAIFLFEISRQRKEAGINYSLSDLEKDKLINDFKNR